MSNNKQKRNDPCSCGSGVKYKYCHLRIERKIEMETNNEKPSDLSNKFRDELEAKANQDDPIKAETELVGYEEMARRDAICTLRQFQVQKMTMEMDHANCVLVMRAYELLLDEVKDAPTCAAREGLLDLLPKTLAKLEQQKAQSKWKGVNVVLLAALESSLVDVGGSVGNNGDGDKLNPITDKQIEESLGETDVPDKEDTSLDDEPDNQDDAI